MPEGAASLPPQDGAKQNGCSIGHSSQAKRRPPSRLGAYFIDHVAVQVGLAYPENRKENDDVTPDGNKEPGHWLLKEGGTEEGSRHHQAEDAQR
ncbi:hypothetical protein LJB63_17625, partial [[Eubacterium] rectale]|nr:hypothetical protein [Agathobacter rectalis]